MEEFGFTEEHTFLRQTVQTFVKRELLPGAKERTLLNHIPDWVIKKVADQGYIGMAAPEKYGGQASWSGKYWGRNSSPIGRLKRK